MLQRWAPPCPFAVFRNAYKMIPTPYDLPLPPLLKKNWPKLTENNKISLAEAGDNCPSRSSLVAFTSQTSCQPGDSNTWPARFEECYSRCFLFISSLTIKSCALKPSSFVSYFQRFCHRKGKILTAQSSLQPGERSGIALSDAPSVSPGAPVQGSPASHKHRRREATLPPAVLHKLQGQVQHEEQRANDSLPSCHGKSLCNLKRAIPLFFTTWFQLMQRNKITPCLFKMLRSPRGSCFCTGKAEFLCIAVRFDWLKNILAESHDYQCTCYLHRSLKAYWYNAWARNNKNTYMLSVVPLETA